ncbi:ZIP family metal transporter [Candidatus Parcubacteria bacterium]|nr:ZIP family metal transporter [Candidatus Parcubacteria bacterium]
MTSLLWILLATFAIAALSLTGTLFIFLKGRHLSKFLLTLVALSAGVMLGNVAFHLLPETFELAGEGKIDAFVAMLLFVISFVLSFLFERLFVWHHCHSAAHQGETDPTFHCQTPVKGYAQLVLASDAIHNFIDGLILAAAFTLSPSLGFATTAAIALHEVPQELGDFAVLVHGGYKKLRALVLNFFSASTVILGGLVGFYLTSSADLAVPILIPLAAGSFLYIAASDLLPELKHEENRKQTLLHAAVFLLGIALMAVTGLLE